MQYKQKLQKLLRMRVQHSSHHTVLLSEGNRTPSLDWHAELQDTTRLVSLMRKHTQNGLSVIVNIVCIT